MRVVIGICDDEVNEVSYLNSLVKRWADINEHNIKISSFNSAEAFLFEYEENKSFDILLLDIQMKKIDGVELAKAVRATNKEIQFIFITGYIEYIADGYDVEALNYLLKPVNEERLFSVLDKAITKLVDGERVLLINHSGESVRVPLNIIRYLEVTSNYVTIYADDEYTIKRTLSDIEKELSDDFFRVGRSYIVNLKYIRKVTKTLIYLSDATIIPLSRGMYDSLNRAIIERL